MPKPLPPLTWFRSFEAAARTLSSTAAAKEIGLTQSAVSQQIRALESQLGVALFRRHARGLSLTDEGRKLLPQVEDALQTLTVATAPYLGMQEKEDLSVAASLSVIEWVIAPALPQFRARYPDLAIRFLATIWPDEFSLPRADMEIRFGSQRQVGKDAIALQHGGLVAVKSPGRQGGIRDLPLIETIGTSDGWSTWSEVTGISGLEPAYFVDSYGLAAQLAANGNGVALVSSLIAKRALETGLLEKAEETIVPAKEGYFLSVQHPSASALAFRDWFLELVSAAG